MQMVFHLKQAGTGNTTKLQDTAKSLDAVLAQMLLLDFHL